MKLACRWMLSIRSQEYDINYSSQDSFSRFPSVPFYPFSFWVPLLKPNSRKKGTLIIKGLLGNLVILLLCRTGALKAVFYILPGSPKYP